MKSPLVDALRLASGQDKAANNEEPRPAEETAAPDADVASTELHAAPGERPAAEVPELSLMDATGVLVVQSPDAADDEFAASQVIPEDAVNEAVAAIPAAPVSIAPRRRTGGQPPESEILARTVMLRAASSS